MRAFIAVIACTILAAAPAAAQRGHGHPNPHPAVQHPAPPAHPTAPAGHHATPHHAAVPQQITSNPALVTRLTPLLPSGMTLASAAAGFKNQGQFVAALHVSRNLGIPFADLKTAMTTNHASLGQAIQQLRPTADSRSAVRTAEASARVDLKTKK